MKEFASYLIPLCVTLLWIGMLAPAILRVFGIPMAIGSWRLDRLNRHLSRRRYVWGYGAFSFGIGMLFLTALRDYLPWRGTHDRVTLFDAILRLIIWLSAGWLIGSLGGAQQKTSNAPVGNKPWNR